MKEALIEAKKAYYAGDVPIGAIVIKDDCIVGRGHNRTESDKDPTAHAEIIAIRQAAAYLGGWRLFGCTMYVTVEPCAMCAGALVLARMDKVVIGTPDPKAGACGSVLNVLQEERLNHHVQIETGVMQRECEGIMKDFFKKIRTKKLEDSQL